MIYMKVMEIEKKLKKILKPERYRHTLGVAYTAASMAMVFDEDLEKAYRAGLLHDCAKGFSLEEQRDLCRKYGLCLEGALTDSPQLMHSALAPFLAKSEYGEHDSEILSAVRYHTTGRMAMSLLEQIVFIADYIEPNRKMIPGLSEIRKLAFCDLEKCTYKILTRTIAYLKQCGQKIDQGTEETCQYYEMKTRHETKGW